MGGRGAAQRWGGASAAAGPALKPRDLDGCRQPTGWLAPTVTLPLPLKATDLVALSPVRVAGGQGVAWDARVARPLGWVLAQALAQLLLCRAGRAVERDLSSTTSCLDAAERLRCLWPAARQPWQHRRHWAHRSGRGGGAPACGPAPPGGRAAASPPGLQAGGSRGGRCGAVADGQHPSCAAPSCPGRQATARRRRQTLACRPEPTALTRARLAVGQVLVLVLNQVVRRHALHAACSGRAAWQERTGEGLLKRAPAGAAAAATAAGVVCAGRRGRFHDV